MALASEITRCCSITNRPSRSMHTVNGLWNSVSRDDRINHSVLPTSPSCAQWTCCIMLVLYCRFATCQLKHTPWSARMTGTPLRVCAPSPLPSSGTLCCWLKQTLSVANLHPPDGRLQDAVHSPVSVHTNPAFQSRPTLSLLLNVTVQAPHTHPMVSPRMPCTPLRVCTPSSGFPIQANTIINVKCNCAGSLQTNSHTPHGQPTDNIHCPTACTPPPASLSRPAPPSTSSTTTEFLNDLKTIWSTPLPVASHQQ